MSGGTRCSYQPLFRGHICHICCIYFPEMFLILPLRQKGCFIHISFKAQAFHWRTPSVQTPVDCMAKLQVGAALEGKIATWYEHRLDSRVLHFMITFFFFSFFLGRSGGALDSKTAYLGFSQGSTAN